MSVFLQTAGLTPTLKGYEATHYCRCRDRWLDRSLAWRPTGSWQFIWAVVAFIIQFRVICRNLGRLPGGQAVARLNAIGGQYSPFLYISCIMWAKPLV